MKFLQDAVQMYLIYLIHFNFKTANCHQQHPPSATSGPSVQVPHSATVYSFMAASSSGTSLSVFQCDVAAGLPGLWVNSVDSVDSVTEHPCSGVDVEIPEAKILRLRSVSINFHHVLNIIYIHIYTYMYMYTV